MNSIFSKGLEMLSALSHFRLDLSGSYSGGGLRPPLVLVSLCLGKTFSFRCILTNFERFRSVNCFLSMMKLFPSLSYLSLYQD